MRSVTQKQKMHTEMVPHEVVLSRLRERRGVGSCDADSVQSASQVVDVQFLEKPFGPTGRSRSGIDEEKAIDVVGMEECEPGEDVSAHTNAETYEVFDVVELAYHFDLFSELIHGGVDVVVGQRRRILLLARGIHVEHGETLEQELHVYVVEEGLEVGHMVQTQVVVRDDDRLGGPVVGALVRHQDSSIGSLDPVLGVGLFAFQGPHQWLTGLHVPQFYVVP